MKEKLKKFKNYSDSLLPFESGYLLGLLNTKDEEKESIMKLIHDNSSAIIPESLFDISIDKRKYSSLMKWMQEQLSRIDVDQQFQWISEVHESILLDRISIKHESLISKSIKSFHSNDYYFMSFYEMLLDYRHYLLIRMRYADHSRIDNYLNKYKFDYQRSKLVNDQMHQATVDILGKNNELSSSGIQWEKWMLECLESETLDGLNRYMALVRLNFVYLRYNMMDKLGNLLDKATAIFEKPKYYSRRLLLNYYDNLVVFFDKKNDHERARYYGYLSIRDINQDSIIYINNLVNVLIKMKRYEEALSLIDSINFKIKTSRNFHSVIGFVSNHVRVLTKLGRLKEAVTKARVFLNAFDKLILKYRWYRFFSAYLGALLSYEKYSEVIKLCDRYQLLEKEANFSSELRAGRIIAIYYFLSQINKSTIAPETFKIRIRPLISDNDYLNTLDDELIEMIRKFDI